MNKLSWYVNYNQVNFDFLALVNCYTTYYKRHAFLCTEFFVVFYFHADFYSVKSRNWSHFLQFHFLLFSAAKKKKFCSETCFSLLWKSKNAEDVNRKKISPGNHFHFPLEMLCTSIVSSAWNITHFTFSYQGFRLLFTDIQKEKPTFSM